MKQEQLIKKCIDNPQSLKIVSLPLQFAYLPVDIISKQFTKLNSPHEHRIHYLGPRYGNTQTLHKKCAYIQNAPLCKGTPDRKINKYRMDIKRITNSFFINERLRTNHFYKTGLYYRAFEGMNPTLNLQQQFLFNGSFQSANLDCVIQIKPKQFDLFLRIDSNTRGHLQWFYFSIQNGQKLQKIKLNICNISKPGTLYEQKQMKPYVFSKKAFQKSKISWLQGGDNVSNISFSQKSFNYKILIDKVATIPYCYSFQFEFQNENDQVYFAYCIPYTYSQMLYDIETLPTQITKIYSLGRSLTGLQIPLLHITDQSVQSSEKKNILVTGRVHPGQSNGSLMLKGFINFLCSSDKSAIELRRHANFFIIPMLNPDGVILGNSRCSASGRDLNRIFPNSDKQLFPQISCLKSFTSKFINHKQILLYYDFHGHSRKKNTFFYGPSYSISNPNYLKCRVLPRIIQKINNGFRYHSCLFSISENKKSTGRATMFQTYQIPFTYTIQSSIGFYYDSQLLKTFSFDKQAYEKMGSSICEGTSTFVIALEEYQKFLKERRAERQRRKNQKSSLSRKNYTKSGYNAQDQMGETGNNTILKISYTQKEHCLFIKLLQQINKMPQIPCSQQKGQKDPQIDQQISSDEHDDKQDFEVTKLKQFNNLIIQNARKDNLMTKLNQSDPGAEVNSFVRSGNIVVNKQSSKHLNRNWQIQQLQFFQQMNIKSNIKPKSKSSYGNRIINTEERSATANLRKKIIRGQNNRMRRNFMSFNNQLSYDQQDKKPQQEMKNFFLQLEGINTLNQNSQLKFRTSTLRKFGDKHQKKLNSQKSSHFSELQFPQNQMLQQKKIMKHQKTDLFRKNLQRKRQKSDKTRSQGINCSQMTIIRHPRKQFFDYQDIKKQRMTEFKIQDLMSNLQFRSKIMRDSVKYRDQRKVKAKSNFMFPSSFYGMKQQINAKRRPSYSRQHSQSFQQPLDLTVKQFYK